jgi:hypothetical protein
MEVFLTKPNATRKINFPQEPFHPGTFVPGTGKGLYDFNQPMRAQLSVPPTLREVSIMSNQRNDKSLDERRSYSDPGRSRKGNDSGEAQRSQGYEYDDDYNRGPAYYDDRGQYSSSRDRDGSGSEREWREQRQFDRTRQTPRDYANEERDDRGREYQYDERDQDGRPRNTQFREENGQRYYGPREEHPLHSQRDYEAWRDDSPSYDSRGAERPNTGRNYRERSDYGEFSSRGLRQSRPERDIR